MSARVSAASLNMAVAMALGAFGAHFLKDKINPEQLTVYHTASLYHLVMGALLLGLSWQKAVPRWFFVAGGVGTILFCGSLYGLAVSGVRVLGAITPLGGVIWIASFVGLAIWSAPIGTIRQNVEQRDERSRSED